MTPTSLLDRLQATLSDRYRIERELGEGGMAVVYLATDLKHARPVALKVLRPELTAVVGADRFLREIQVTAKLQHPHIVPLFDSGVADELLYYVMPVIDGETLRQRLTREGELPVDEGVALIRAVAGALDYAHRHDVVHRDIKPENVLLHDGQPLLADFGIGLAVSAMGDDRLTSTGFSVGTPGYMSPEQMAGERKLDARSDIYALGCVAYEVLAGEPPFTGRTMHAVVSAVMTSDPAPLTERRRAVPEGVGAAIHRSLQRVPADRFATAAQFASALATGSDPQLRAHPRTEITAVRRRSSFLMPLVAGVVLGGVAAFALFAARARIGARAVEPTVTRRWDIALPDDAPVALGGAGSSPVGQTSIALSPAGDRLAYVAPRGASTVLMLRDLSGDSSIALRATEGAYRPFFSPDGTWIGFFAGNLLRKIPVAGGDPVTVAPVNRISGVNWIADDRILLFQNNGFDFRSISASGARTDSTVHLTTQFGEPDLLPGGEWVVGHLGSGQLALLSITEGTELAITRRGVLALDSVGTSDLLFGTSPKWVPPGHLVYSTADGVLMAMPFDGAGRKVLGEAVPILAGVRMEGGFGYGEYALAHDGTLVYLHGRNQLYSSFAFVSPTGKLDTLPLPRAQYTQPRLSPDGTELAAQVRKQVGGWEVRLMNLETGLTQPVHIEGDYRAYPASWLPTGHELMIGIWNPVQFINNGARIQSLDTGKWTDISLPGASYMTVAPDGKSFVFSDWRTGDLYLRALRGDTTRTSIGARGFAASFSPNGRWLAWGGVDGSVAVSPVPPNGAIYPVAEHGEMPLWTPKSDGIVYRDGSRYWRMPVSTAGGFRAGRAQQLIEGSFLSTFAWNHDISHDGRLLVLLTSPEREARTLGVITGLPGMLARMAHERSPGR